MNQPLNKTLTEAWDELTKDKESLRNNAEIKEIFQMTVTHLLSPTTPEESLPSSPEELKAMFRQASQMKLSGNSQNLKSMIDAFFADIVNHAVEAGGYHLPDVERDEMTAKEMYSLPLMHKINDD